MIRGAAIVYIIGYLDKPNGPPVASFEVPGFRLKAKITAALSTWYRSSAALFFKLHSIHLGPTAR